MSALTTATSESIPRELSLFSINGVQAAVEKSYFQDYRPINPISDQSPIEFNISGKNGHEYLDLHNSRLYVKCKIVNENGTALTKNVNCAPINSLLQSLWQQIDVVLQGKTISTSNNHYAYKAMIQTLMKNTDSPHLEGELFIKDSAGSAIDSAEVMGANHGLYSRHKFTEESKLCDLIGDLHFDLIKNKRYILNGVDTRIVLHRNSPEFLLMTKEEKGKKKNYKIVLSDVIFKARKIILNSALMMAIDDSLLLSNAKYPFTQSGIKVLNVPANQLSLTWDNIFQNSRPFRILVGFVSTTAFTGDYKKNPFNFQHFNISNISLMCDGDRINSYHVNFDKDTGYNYIDVYNELFNFSSEMKISRHDFKGGYALFPFILEPNFTSIEFISLIKQGNIRLEVNFQKALPESVTIVLYYETLGYFEIDYNRSVITS